MQLEDFGYEWDQRLVLEELELEGEKQRCLKILTFSHDMEQEPLIPSPITVLQ